jgi:phosphatidate cytidylyltransferase
VLKQRVITAIVLAAVLLAAVFFLPLSIFATLAALVFVVGAWEWSRLAHFSGAARAGFALAFALLIAVCWWWIGFQRLAGEIVDGRMTAVAALAVIWWFFATWLVKSYPAHARFWSRRWEQTLMGLLVLVPAWAAIVFLRAEPAGDWLILILVASVAGADIGAFFVGRKWGKRKLAPSVSPGKSREGFLGGFVASLLFAIVLALALGGGEHWWLLALIVPASLASVMGDLLESMLKRQRGIKDSGAILPGHGGILDRIDSITAAAPVFALAYLLSGYVLSGQALSG